MKYRELIEKMKTGTLEEEMKKKVMADIERQEAIGEYLLEQMDEEWEQNTSGEFSNDDTLEEDKASAKGSKVGRRQKNVIDDRQSEEFTRLINKSIHRAFVKMGTAVTAVVMAVVLFCMFGLSPLVAAFYYNPEKVVIKEKKGKGNWADRPAISRLELDWDIYSNLTLPGKHRDEVSVQNNGFGNYEITIHQTTSFNGRFVDVAGKINKGELTIYNPSLFYRPSANCFAVCNLPKEGGTIEERVEKAKEEWELSEDEVFGNWITDLEYVKEDLRKLDENEVYVGYVTFEQDMDFDELQKFIAKLPDDADVEWNAVRTSEDCNGMSLGYATENAGKVKDYILEGYPDLYIYEGRMDMDDDSFELHDKRIKDEEWCTSHFCSMLRYMADQKGFQKLVGGDTQEYVWAAKYIEDNGLSFYGVMIRDDKDTLLKINDMEEVYGVYVDEQ